MLQELEFFHDIINVALGCNQLLKYLALDVGMFLKLLDIIILWKVAEERIFECNRICHD